MNFLKNRQIKAGISLLLSILLIFSGIVISFNVSAEEANNELKLDLSTAMLFGDAIIDDYGIKVTGDSKISFDFVSDTAMKAEAYIEYKIHSTGNRSIELGADFNGLVFPDETLTLPRVFKDDEWTSLDQRPKQLLIEDSITNPLRYYDQRAGERLFFDVKAGQNQLSLSFIEQNFTIISILLVPSTSVANYKPINDLKSNDGKVVIEAEKATFKSDSSLSPTYDLTSSVTSPYSFESVYLNTIGSATWNTPGQWIKWEFDIKKSGYYNLSMRVRQNESRGLNSYRRISIDDAVLYTELETYAFKYDRGWYVETLNDGKGNDIYVWLEAGTHTLKMEAVMGDAMTTFDTINQVVNELNSIYRNIIMITGTSPDTNRSYRMFSKIPSLPDDFKRLSKQLKAEIERVESQNNSKGTAINFLNQFSSQLEDFSKSQDLVVSSLSTFKSNISTLASQLTSLSAQPLEVDQIIFSQKDSGLVADMSLFERFIFEFKRFLLSFTQDYGQTFNTDEDVENSLIVWCMMGRDQAQIINDMVADTFTPQTGVNVKVSVVTAGLSEAIMAKKGPDVVMGVDSQTAINLGVREALEDVSKYKQYDSIISRFQESSMLPYSYRKSVYAIPNTQDFNMMFIRTDIYDELGLEVCQTWNDLLKQLSIFSQYHMTAGIPSSIITTMMLQNNMNYYNESLTKTVFSTEEAYDVYKDFVSLYTDYETPVAFDAANRFRSGEMPVVISSFSFYNTLSVLAPELQGLWDMYLIPGTEKEDGSIDRSTESIGTGSAIISASSHKKEAIEFLDWWTTKNSQSRFCQEIENILGRSGRYATANIEAFNTLNWPSTQMQKLQKQRTYISNIPGTPVAYIVTRNMNNIFLMTVNNGYNLKEMMIKYSRQMDDEITRKYNELESYR